MGYNFTYISKRDPKVIAAYSNLCKLINDMQEYLRKDFTFQFYPIGSYARNMMTYDWKSNIGFDFDINLVPNNCNKFSAKTLRLKFQQALNHIAPKYGYDFPEGSTRVLTIKVKDRNHSKIIHSCDFAIVTDYEDEDGYCRQKYIRYNKSQNSYSWCQQKYGYYMLSEKIAWVKEKGLWEDAKQLYIINKNSNTDPYSHSRAVFASTIHEICQQHGYFLEE